MFFAFLSASILLYTAAGHSNCTDAERSIWFKNQAFADQYATCSRNSWGDSAESVKCLSALYPDMSIRCHKCFGAATACGLAHCRMPCLSGSHTSDCLGCIDTHCSANLMECTGVASKSDLPIPPSPPKPEPVISRKRRAQEVVEPDESAASKPAADAVPDETKIDNVEPEITTTDVAVETTTTGVAVETTTTAVAVETPATQESTKEVITPGAIGDELATTTSGSVMMSTIAAVLLVSVTALL